MQQLKTRRFKNILTYYCDASTGQPIRAINSVSFDGSDTVYTITNKDGELWVRVSSRNMALMKLEDVIDKLNLIVYKIS